MKYNTHLNLKVIKDDDSPLKVLVIQYFRKN